MVEVLWVPEVCEQTDSGVVLHVCEGQSDILVAQSIAKAIHDQLGGAGCGYGVALA